jgi:hypothetical protein
MDKLAYHYNKKKIPAKTEGKYLYYYPCEDMESATVQMGGRGFVTIEVTEKEWEALIELDRIKYNNFLYSIEETRKRQLIHGLLNNIFKYALSLDMVEKNPCGNISKTKHETNEGTAFSFAEQKDFCIVKLSVC